MELIEPTLSVCGEILFAIKFFRFLYFKIIRELLIENFRFVYEWQMY